MTKDKDLGLWDLDKKYYQKQSGSVGHAGDSNSNADAQLHTPSGFIVGSQGTA